MNDADAEIIDTLLTSAKLTTNAAASTGVLSRITVEELIELTIDLTSRAAIARTNHSAAVARQAILTELSPPSDWYITKSALWKQNPSNPGRPTVLARMSHSGLLLVHSPEVWKFLQRVTPLPPAITELRKLHGEDVPTGALPTVDSTVPNTTGHVS